MSSVQPSESHPAAIEINGKTPNFPSHIRLALFHGLKQSNRYQVSSTELVWSTKLWTFTSSSSSMEITQCYKCPDLDPSKTSITALRV
ncbi:hypothetical protein HGM15179_007265 [Zosterops borbonicus]|uniref:Uncharacterized protein n=1 Tax=Zosterops borbonicus TaxID=364589 RepID=A0A8K1GKS8_9PASS|nr:hypothetical protein HGM15179_007265 [Zosterops borbonicus]